MEVISEILSKHKFIATTDCLQHLFLNIYEGFVEELDAIDNGVPMYPEGRPRYRIGTHLSARVHRLNPEWNAADDVNPDQLFSQAIDMVGKEFTERVIEVNKVKNFLRVFIETFMIFVFRLRLFGGQRGRW